MPLSISRLVPFAVSFALLAACDDSPSMIGVAEPVIDSFTAAHSPITRGASTTLIPSFRDGVGAIDPEVGAVESGLAVTVTPQESTTYTLTVLGRSMTPVTAAVTVEVIDSPTAPAITAPPFVTAQQPGYSATIQAQEGCTYSWSIEGGTLESGATGTEVFFSPGDSGSVQLHCSVANQLGTSVTASATSAIVPPPGDVVLELPSLVTLGNAYVAKVMEPVEGSSYRWTVDGGTFPAEAGPELHFVAAGEPGGNLIVTCSEVNAAGTLGDSSFAAARIVAPPNSFSIEAPARVTARSPGYVASAPLQPGCAYGWQIVNGTIEGDSTAPSITFTPGEAGTVELTCYVYNEAGDASESSGRSIPILPEPAAPTILAPSLVTSGRAHAVSIANPTAGSRYDWVVSGGTPASFTGSALSFTPFGASGDTLLLLCAETNAAGSTGPEALFSAGIVSPPIKPLLSAPQFVTAGESYVASVQAPAPGSTFSWTLTGGTPSSAQGTIITFAPNGAKDSTVTLHAVETNRAGSQGPQGSATSTVSAAPVAPLIAVAQFVTAGQQATASVEAPVAGSTYAWTIDGGSPANGSGTSVTFTAGASGAVVLSCTETNAAGSLGLRGNAFSSIVAPPVVPVVQAPSLATVGRSFNARVTNPVALSSYRWSVVGGTSPTARGTASSSRPRGAPAPRSPSPASRATAPARAVATAWPRARSWRSPSRRGSTCPPSSPVAPPTPRPF